MTGKKAPEKQNQFIEDAFESVSMPPARRTAEFELPPFDDPKYRKEIEEFDLTEEQATEFLRNLDFILRAFVNLGFGVDAVQLALPSLTEISQQCESLADFSGAAESRRERMNNSDVFNNAATELPQKE